MNLFDEGHEEEGFNMMNMMDWNIENWLSLILSVGIILLIAMALILIFIYFYRNGSVKNQSFQTNSGILRNNETNAYSNAHEKHLSEKASFCYKCGEELGDRLLINCPQCGAKL